MRYAGTDREVEVGDLVLFFAVNAECPGGQYGIVGELYPGLIGDTDLLGVDVSPITGGVVPLDRVRFVGKVVVPGGDPGKVSPAHQDPEPTASES